MGNKGSKSEIETTIPEEDPLYKSEWRKMDWNDRDEMINRLRQFQPQNKSIKHIRMLLHGPVGSGKSSFINSVNSSLRGQMTHDAHADNAAGTSFTLKTQTHKIQKGNAQIFYPFVFNDIMGLEEENGINEEDIKLVMKGHVKDGYTFNPVSPMSDKDPYYNHHPNPEDKIHVLVSVIPADRLALLSQGLLDKIRRIRLAASEIGIPQICIITMIDQTCDEIKADIKKVYKMKIVKKKMDVFSTKSGVPMNCIFPVKNYHEEIDLDNDTDVMILRALKQMVDFGEDFINRMFTSC